MNALSSRSMSCEYPRNETESKSSLLTFSRTVLLSVVVQICRHQVDPSDSGNQKDSRSKNEFGKNILIKSKTKVAGIERVWIKGFSAKSKNKKRNAFE